MPSEQAFQSTGGRRSERWAWQADVQFRSGPKRANVKICDISTLGARVQGVFLVREGEHFFIKLPGLDSIEARVAWVTDFEFGCEFLQPLNDAVLNARLSQR